MATNKKLKTEMISLLIGQEKNKRKLEKCRRDMNTIHGLSDEAYEKLLDEEEYHVLCHEVLHTDLKACNKTKNQIKYKQEMLKYKNKSFLMRLLTKPPKKIK